MELTPCEATLKLTAHCLDSDWSPDLHLLRQYVEEGADVLLPVGHCRNSIFFQMVEMSNIKAVNVCLTTSRVMDFTIRGSKGENPLQAACQGSIADCDTTTLLSAMIYRIECHPLDIVDWRQKDSLGRDFLAIAAQFQKLSVVWPLVSNVPAFSDEILPIPLRHDIVWEVDWNQLPHEEQSRLSIQKSRMIILDAPTAQLCKLSLLSACSAEEVRRCVEENADVMYQKPGTASSILHNFILDGCVAIVRALLCSPRSIDFTLRGECGRTPLHCICGAPSRVAAGLLELVVERIQRCPADIVDWQMRDRLGHDFISSCAENKMLSLLFPVLRRGNISLFSDEDKPVRVDVVHKEDWDHLSDKDKRQIIVEKGIFL